MQAMRSAGVGRGPIISTTLFGVCVALPVDGHQPLHSWQVLPY